LTTHAPLITIGIDVGGSRKGFLAVALTEGAYTVMLHCRDVEEIVC
jgi:predicted rRNA methylase YqxC with S4 and FtsJ domains